jgi:hypothetical protein
MDQSRIHLKHTRAVVLERTAVVLLKQRMKDRLATTPDVRANIFQFKIWCCKIFFDHDFCVQSQFFFFRIETNNID